VKEYTDLAIAGLEAALAREVHARNTTQKSAGGWWKWCFPLISKGGSEGRAAQFLRSEILRYLAAPVRSPERSR